MSLLTLFRKLSGFLNTAIGKSRVIALIFPVLILASCGLPTYSYLYPPTGVYSRENPESLQEQNLIFSNAYQNNLSIFTGYEVYYKIYDPLSSTAAAALYETEVSTIKNSTSADYNTLNSKGFHRLFFSTSDISSSAFSHDTSKPSFTPDSALLDDNFQIRLNLNQSGPYSQAEPYNTSLLFSSVPYMYRWVHDDSPNAETIYTAKQFSTGSFDYRDSDLPDTISSSDTAGTDYLYITFFIMSFGRGATDITSLVYSTPVYLGTLKFDCTLTDNFY